MPEQSTNQFAMASNQFAMASTGDPDEDAVRLQQAQRSLERRSEGMCPNGHGPMYFPNSYEMRCPHCRFFAYSSTPHNLGADNLDPDAGDLDAA